jgi:hypothetical protein
MACSPQLRANFLFARDPGATRQTRWNRGSLLLCRFITYEEHPACHHRQNAISSAGRLEPPVGTTMNCLPFSM